MTVPAGRWRTGSVRCIVAFALLSLALVSPAAAKEKKKKKPPPSPPPGGATGANSQPKQKPKKARHMDELMIPQWLSPQGKELWAEYFSQDEQLSDEHCDVAFDFVPHVTSTGHQEGEGAYMAMMGVLGPCAFKEGEYKASKTYFGAMLDMMSPNREQGRENKDISVFIWVEEAAESLSRFDFSHAATCLRSARVKHMEYLEQQSMITAEMRKEFTGYGKVGKYLPAFLKNSPKSARIHMDIAYLEFIDMELKNLDAILAKEEDSLQKDKRDRLGGDEASDKMLYVPGIFSEAIVDPQRLKAAKQLLEAGIDKAMAAEADQDADSVELLSSLKDGHGCENEQKKGLTKICKAVKKVADIRSNIFGETLLLTVFDPVELQLCSTNANVGILFSVTDGVRVTLVGTSQTGTLEAGVPMVVDFCRPIQLEGDKKTSVLFAQAWHPEFTALERKAAIEKYRKAFKFSSTVVETAQLQIKASKIKQSAADWREDSDLGQALRKGLKAAKESKKPKPKVDRKKRDETPTHEEL
eukprot:gnl/TRDRNA2_/TRDRNA2_29452_c0_seq1.p1 gnl/TRDRNA2_/TRDRNA2_29452_c0~~gnl/TRDRNA2_/TRDRNA2_29452_c0_seq1.p1  ORF type:complete len:527 (-),score=126.53 gnl/TRDRNA2_/TRDRNA2_29452_c0_seq1:139-1719(-)